MRETSELLVVRRFRPLPHAQLARTYVSSAERDHLYATWLSVVRKVPLYQDSKKVPNPRHVERFAGRFRAFQRWSLQNGYASNRELVIVETYLRPGTRLVRHREPRRWVEGQGWRQDIEDRLESDDGLPEPFPEEGWVADQEYAWVPIREIAARRPRPLLTGYGVVRLKAWKVAQEERKARRKAKEKEGRRGKARNVSAWGETKSVDAWANDPRAGASDKTICARIARNWSAEDAISTPGGIGGRPRQA